MLTKNPLTAYSVLRDDIRQLVIPLIKPSIWQQARKLGENKRLHVFLGMHPCALNDYRYHDIAVLDGLLSTHKGFIRGIGEIGLDYRFDSESAPFLTKNEISVIKMLQKDLFKEQLKLAKRHNVPIIVYANQSDDDVLHLLKIAQLNQAGFVYDFTGTPKQAEAYLSMGYKLEFGGGLIYPAVKCLEKIVANPLSPYVVVEAQAVDVGEENHARYLDNIAKALSKPSL